MVVARRFNIWHAHWYKCCFNGATGRSINRIIPGTAKMNNLKSYLWKPIRTKSLKACIEEGRRNNLNAVRLVLAGLVVLAHSFQLASGKVSDPFYSLCHNQESCGILAVNLFFFISGVLITGSWFNSKTMTDYIRRRILRIVPAFVVALAFTIMIAAAFSTHPFALIRFQVHSFVSDIISLGRSSTLAPWIFKNNPYPTDGNASLWTIPIEFDCYLSVAAVGAFGLFKYRKLILAAFFLTLFFYSRPPLGEFQRLNELFLGCYTFFLAGSCAWLWRDRIPVHGAFAILAFAVSTAATQLPPLFLAVSPFTITYLALWFGYARSWSMTAWFDKTDLSYGTYLFGFPIQQALICATSIRNSWIVFAMSMPVVLGAAFLSWNLVEKRFLKLKSATFANVDPAISTGERQSVETPSLPLTDRELVPRV